MAEDSVSAHVAQQQKKWEEYCGARRREAVPRHDGGVDCHHAGEPRQIHVRYLAKHYPEALEGERGGAGGRRRRRRGDTSGIRARPRGARERCRSLSALFRGASAQTTGRSIDVARRTRTA